VPGSPHNANIDAIYIAGVTSVCVPNEQYCPTAVVTRQEMASFLARLGGLGTNPPVTNAKAAGGYAPNGLVRVARAGGTVADTPLTTAATTVKNGTITLDAPTAGFVLVTGTVTFANYTTACGTATSGNGFVQIVDTVAHTTSPIAVAAPPPARARRRRP